MNISGGSRIFQTGGDNPKRWAPTYYLVNFLGNATCKRKKLDREWGRASMISPSPGSANIHVHLCICEKLDQCGAAVNVDVESVMRYPEPWGPGWVPGEVKSSGNPVFIICCRHIDIPPGKMYGSGVICREGRGLPEHQVKSLH